MKPYHRVYEEIVERVQNSSRKEVATRIVYDPVTGMKSTYYQDKVVFTEPYKVDMRWGNAGSKS